MLIYKTTWVNSYAEGTYLIMLFMYTLEQKKIW